MKILVVGSGGREHAIVWAFSCSERVSKIYCANGNAGIAQLAECVDISPTDIDSLVKFAQDNSIDLTFVGGETSLAEGIVNEFRRVGLRIIGATKEAAQLESSKAFAKDFMRRHKIPTANFRVAGSISEAVDILDSGEFGGEVGCAVVKADGLAAGKGVIVCKNRDSAIAAVESLIAGEIVDSNAANRIVIEELLVGREVSLLMFVDGDSFALMPPTRDHKRIGENDSGENTGGMGAVTDEAMLSREQLAGVVRDVIEPTLQGAKSDGIPFSGILFLGLMVTNSGIKVLEYNVRFGDPETQAILVRLETDFYEICEAMENDKLSALDIEWKDGNSTCVVLAAAGYPKGSQVGDVIEGIASAETMENAYVFHAGTALDDNGNFVTNGGRILGVTASASNLPNSLHRAYKAVNEISWDGMQFRRDIGK